MNRFFTLLFAASSLTAVGQVPDYVPTDGLVGWWPLNGQAQNAFSEFHQGQLDGPVAAVDRFGQANGALFFDGADDGMFIPHDEALSTFEQSIAFWMRIESPELMDTPGLSNGMGLVNKTLPGASNKQNRHFAISLGSSEEPSPEPYHVTLASSNGQPNNVESATTAPMFFSEEWYFVVAVLTEDSLVVFVDGVEEVSSSLDHPRIQNTAQIKLGIDYNFTDSRYFYGSLDDFGIWNRALSGVEVAALFEAPIVVSGCTDPEACNYASEANMEDGSCHFLCEYCIDGTIWDEELQGCVHGQSADINNDGCVQLNDLLDLLSAYGDCGSEESAWQCGDPLEYQGYDYETVQIGEQCWFAENLRAENYNSGEEIRNVVYEGEWINSTANTTGMTAIYGVGESLCGQTFDIDSACYDTWSLHHFGRLYNWFAVASEGGLCPTSWKVPSDDEWNTLANFLGGQSVAGYYMKTDFGWHNEGVGDNSSGFSGRPSGHRTPQGLFVTAGNEGWWWTSTGGDWGAYYRKLKANNDAIYTSYSDRRFGYSVRCIKDTE